MPSVRRSIERHFAAARVRAPRRIVVRAHDHRRTGRDIGELHVPPRKSRSRSRPLPVVVTTARVGVSSARNATKARAPSSAKRPLGRGNRATRPSRRTGASRPSAAFRRRTPRAASPRWPGRRMSRRRRPDRGNVPDPAVPHLRVEALAGQPGSRPSKWTSNGVLGCGARIAVHVAMRADLDQDHVPSAAAIDR